MAFTFMLCIMLYLNLTWCENFVRVQVTKRAGIVQRILDTYTLLYSSFVVHVIAYLMATVLAIYVILYPTIHQISHESSV